MSERAAEAIPGRRVRRSRDRERERGRGRGPLRVVQDGVEGKPPVTRSFRTLEELGVDCQISGSKTAKVVLFSWTR